MRGGRQCGEEGRGEKNHHGEVILGSHLGASPVNSLNLSMVVILLILEQLNTFLKNL